MRSARVSRALEEHAAVWASRDMGLSWVALLV